MINFTIDDLKALLEEISTNATEYVPPATWEAKWLTHYEIEAMLTTIIENPPSGLTPYQLALLKVLSARHTHFRRNILAKRLLKSLTELEYEDF